MRWVGGPGSMAGWLRALSGTAVYLAAAHMVPAPLALDVVTTATATVDEQTRASALRLRAPGRSSRKMPSLCARRKPMTTYSPHSSRPGCVSDRNPSLSSSAASSPLSLMAGATRRPDSCSSPPSTPRASGTGCCSQPSTATTTPADACSTDMPQLAFARWTPPPALPDSGPRPNSRSALGRIATSEAGRSGGFHGVCVLDFTPPPEEPPEERTAPAGARKPLEFGTWRRAHWNPGVRIGIRDSDGRLVGSVYKDGAVEGTTFTRERRFFPRPRIRRDLPLAPTTAVYELSNSAAPRGR